MERSELEHLLRAAGEVIDERQFIVIGSQSILGKYPNAPEELLRSREADFIAKNQPEDDLGRAARIKARIERLYSDREQPLSSK